MFGFDGTSGRHNGQDSAEFLAAMMRRGQPERPESAGTDPLDRFAEFAADVRERLDDGRNTYGDKSFAAKPEALAREIQHELLDVCGWAFVMWTRLERIRTEAERLQLGSAEGEGR